MYFYFYFFMRLVTIAQFPWTLFCQRPRPKFFENTLSCGRAQHKMWRIGKSPSCQLREYGKEMYHKCRRGFLKLPNRGADAAGMKRGKIETVIGAGKNQPRPSAGKEKCNQ